MERDTIVSAIRSTPNLTAAAKQLGASRRTLQNRMRTYGLPRGKSGRPREELPYGTGSAGSILAVAGLVAGAFLVGKWWMSRGKTTVVGYNRGLDVLGGV